MIMTFTRELFILLFFTFVSLAANASPTYSHDNTYCRLKDESIEIEVRSHDQYTIPEESEYGEFIHVKQNNKLQKIQMSPNNIGRYRLLKGESANCSKSLSLPLNNEQLAIFFLKDNKPFRDKLVVLTYNFQTQNHAVLETSYMTEKAKIQEGKLFFESASEDREKRIGQVIISDKKHNFMEKTYEPWMKFEGEKFELDQHVSFMEFEWRHLYPDANSFFRHMKRQKKFIIATNFEAKSTCISFGESFLCKRFNN